MSKVFKSITGVSLSAAALWGACDASASGIFQVKDRSYGAYAGTPAQTAIDTALDELQTQVNDALLKAAEADTYLHAVSNSLATSSAGVGVDYATPFDVFALGVSAGTGADLGSNSVSDLMSGDVKAEDVKGFAAQTAVVVGFNPGSVSKSNWGPIEPHRLRLYFSYFSMNDFTKDKFHLNFSSFGLHAKYQIIEEKNWAHKLVKWGGLDVGAGIHRASMKASISESVTQSQTISSNGLNTTVNFSGDLTAGADASTTTIPLEASTYVRLLYVLAMYTGVGVDLNFGSTSAVANGGGPITSSDSNIGATGALDLGESSSPNKTNVRYFLGGQFDVGVANIFVQYNKSITNNTLGITLGTRVYW
ncbi:MAG: hypothetical protein JST16_00950 [Bdellovibrionales bacterium]|nr:hypothetical protein [Bdellovibrionales bacterium]